MSVDQESDDEASADLSQVSESTAEYRSAVRSATRAGAVLLVAALLLVLVRVLLVQSFVIPSSSMEPTLQVGDRVLVSRWDYRFGEVRRGDVVVFNGEGVFSPIEEEPDSALASAGRSIASALGVPLGEHDFVKRVIGLPGERVVCCDVQGRITVDGVPLAEPYLVDGEKPSMISFDVVVPAGRLWVMGDNRSVSDDSRAHLGEPGNGTVPINHVVGRVVRVWWPLSRSSGVSRGDPLAATTATQGAS